MSHNDITGDKITTDVPSDAYRDNWGKIFGKTPATDELPRTIGEMVEQEKERNANLTGN
jgi:hypothetical protein